MECNRNLENSLQLVEQRNERKLVSIMCELTPMSRGANRIQKKLRQFSVPRSRDEEETEKCLSHRRGAARLTRRSNTEKRGFVIHVRTISPVPGSRSPPAESHSDFLPQGYCRSCEKHVTWLPFTDVPPDREMRRLRRRLRRSGNRIAIIQGVL